MSYDHPGLGASGPRVLENLTIKSLESEYPMFPGTSHGSKVFYLKYFYINDNHIVNSVLDTVRDVRPLFQPVSVTGTPSLTVWESPPSTHLSMSRRSSYKNTVSRVRYILFLVVLISDV